MPQIKEDKGLTLYTQLQGKVPMLAKKGCRTRCVLEVLAKKSSNPTSLDSHYFRLMDMSFQNTYLAIVHACCCLVGISIC